MQLTPYLLHLGLNFLAGDADELARSLTHQSFSHEQEVRC